MDETGKRVAAKKSDWKIYMMFTSPVQSNMIWFVNDPK